MKVTMNHVWPAWSDYPGTCPPHNKIAFIKAFRTIDIEAHYGLKDAKEFTECVPLEMTPKFLKLIRPLLKEFGCKVKIVKDAKDSPGPLDWLLSVRGELRLCYTFSMKPKYYVEIYADMDSPPGCDVAVWHGPVRLHPLNAIGSAMKVYKKA